MRTVNRQLRRSRAVSFRKPDVVVAQALLVDAWLEAKTILFPSGVQTGYWSVWSPVLFEWEAAIASITIFSHVRRCRSHIGELDSSGTGRTLPDPDLRRQGAVRACDPDLLRLVPQ